MAKKKKKKGKKISMSDIIIPVAAVVAVLSALGYIGKRSIEMSVSEKGYIQTQEETPSPENPNNDTEKTENKDNKDGKVNKEDNKVSDAKNNDNSSKPEKKTSDEKKEAKVNNDKNNTKSNATEKKNEDKLSNVKADTYASDASVKKLLQNAFKPMGTTMYIYGGGWNYTDTGAAQSTVTIGVSPEWKNFYSQQDSSYNYKDHSNRTQGLDSSGYIGWVLYNTLRTKDGQDGFVMSSEIFDEKLSELGLGKRTPKEEVTVRRPGDIMSSQSDSFAYIVIGSCNDGSVVAACSSPPGVRLCGTPADDGTQDSEAVILSEQFMNDHFGEWYSKYPDCTKGMAYLTNYDKFSPDTSKVIKDNEGLRSMSAEQVLDYLF